MCATMPPSPAASPERPSHDRPASDLTPEPSDRWNIGRFLILGYATLAFMVVGFGAWGGFTNIAGRDRRPWHDRGAGQPAGGPARQGRRHREDQRARRRRGEGGRRARRARRRRRAQRVRHRRGPVVRDPRPQGAALGRAGSVRHHRLRARAGGPRGARSQGRRADGAPSSSSSRRAPRSATRSCAQLDEREQQIEKQNVGLVAVDKRDAAPSSTC